MIELTIIATFMLYSGMGAATRALFGIYKVYTNFAIYKIDIKRVGIEIIASIFFGAFFTILLQEVGVFKVTLSVLAMIAGFFGADLVDIITKKIGLTKSIQVKITEEEVGSEFNDRQTKALYYLKTHKKITNSGYQKITGASRNTVKRDFIELIEKGKIKKVGSGKRTNYILL